MHIHIYIFFNPLVFFYFFSSPTLRPSDNNKNEITGGTIYEIGNEIEEIFQEDVENIKFKADDISSFFVKNSEIEEEEEKKEFLNYDGYKTNLVDDNCNNNTYEDANGRKTKTLFDPSTCGPYVCCVVILSKKENIQIEFIHPNIHDINEGEILFKSKQNKNKIKKNNKRMITPFNVWYRYKGDWKEDVKMLILERMYLFKEVNTKNFLCNFSNNKSISNNNEYNILYGLSGNRYYIIALNYLEDNKCKEIMIISQVPYFDFIYKHFLTVMQSYLMEKKDSKKENNEIMEEEMEKTKIRPSGKDKTKIAEKEIEIITLIENKKDKSEIFSNGKTEITVNNKTAITAYENTKIRENRKDKTESKKKKNIIERNYKVLEQFIDTFGTHSTIFDKISFNDYYVNLGKDIEELNNMKIKNILIFLKAVLLEKKIAMLCSKKGKGCKMLLLFLSFIPDIINFGFNIKNYERNFEKWEKLKLPLILFHEKYILLLHINNLELFNEYAFEKNYLISTNIESDVYNFVKNDLDLFYDIDTDELVIKNKNLIDALTLTRYENNYLKKIHSFFTYFFNFSSLFFENIKQNHSLINGKNVGNILNPLPVEQDTPTFSNFFSKKGDKSLLMDVDKNGITNCSVINARNGSDICKGNDYHCAFNEGNCDNKTSMSDDAMDGEGIGVGEGACPRDRNILQGNALKNRGISGSRIGSRTGSSDNSSECYSTKYKYFGNFKNNLFNDNGLYVDNILNQYEGEFLNGYINENGKLIFNKNTYIGIFKNSNLIGKGKILYQNGLIYTGEIKDFLPHGYGFLSYNSSTVFEGYFLQGKKNGNGFLTINNNSTSNEIFCIEGKWNNDKPVLKKNFNVLFPNKDKYIGKIYILSSNYGGRSKCHSLNIDDTISENINRNMFEVKKLIANKIAFIKNQDKLNIDETLSPQNDEDSLMDGKVDTTHKDDVNTIISADTTANVCSNSNNNNSSSSSSSRSDSAPSFSSCNILKGKNAKRTEDTIPILTEGKQIQGKHYHHHPPSDEKSITQHAKFIKKTMLKKKLETIMKTKEIKLMKKFFEILDRSWMYNTERKLKNNKEVVEYLQQKNLFLIPHREGICIIHNKKKKENYDGKFCLGMKHGYGISVYDNVNRYEGYWYRGMKHGYGILYEGDNIYYVHFNYDKLIEKQKILHEQLSKYKPKKETSDVVKEYGNHFIINQPFFDYRNFLSSTLCNYL
ncbi:MORN repeat protein, putative [Plasmodium malariae]|uniref:MORN repeat protein, putative n=1 Tax=Plasmodium malariae TaxID=5858 RepID=A0A1C3KDU6_PLAMA|nr:MORN repeat protein, putative [Plasmodium malariae]